VTINSNESHADAQECGEHEAAGTTVTNGSRHRKNKRETNKGAECNGEIHKNKTKTTTNNNSIGINMEKSKLPPTGPIYPLS
jgi:hypothetical protein